MIWSGCEARFPTENCVYSRKCAQVSLEGLMYIWLDFLLLDGSTKWVLYVQFSETETSFSIHTQRLFSHEMYASLTLHVLWFKIYSGLSSSASALAPPLVTSIYVSVNCIEVFYSFSSGFYVAGNGQTAYFVKSYRARQFHVQIQNYRCW